MSEKINGVTPSHQELQAGSPRAERRRKPRVQCSYPARLHGGGRENGDNSEIRAVLANMSAGGFYLHAKRPLLAGEQVHVNVRLSTAPLSEAQVPHISANGRVLRVDAKSDGTYGLAIQLHSHRFP